MDEDKLIKAVFKKYSTNGKLTCPQFVKIIKKLSHHLPALDKYRIEDVSNAFHYFDKDANGTISYDEFVEWWLCSDRYSFITGEKAASLRHMIKIFNKYSTDYKMDSEQFIYAWAEKYGKDSFDRDEVDREFDMIDNDTLGFLTFVEFVDWWNM